LFTQRGYFGPDFPATEPPGRKEVRNAAGLLTGHYGANRLYLVYHHEMPIDDARLMFRWWRESCPKSVELVPALVLRMYDKDQTPVFTAGEVRDLARFFRTEMNPRLAAVYDVYPNRDQGDGLAPLAEAFPGGLIRLGLQPGERLKPPFTAGVQDTWSGFCHGTYNQEDWLQPGFGAATLRGWVAERSRETPSVAWNLVVVAWDYRATDRGGYPGYDDAEKNMPLPAGRNRLGVRLIRDASAGLLAGFSSDLCILNENSRSSRHDGRSGAFYQSLRDGRPYNGYYAIPFQEITGIFRELRTGRWTAAER
jgi:hypothetical protein